MKTTLDEMQALLAVIDCGTLSAAAEQLGQTTSGVSRALARLEQKLGTTLLTRTTRRLHLTAEGEAFVRQARHIVEAVETAEEQMALRRQRPAGRLRVDAAMPFVLHVIAPLVARYRDQFPDVALEVNSSERYIDLLERRTDLAIRIGPLADSTLHARLLGRCRLQLVAGPGYLQRHGMPDSLSALQRHTLLGFNEPESLNRWPVPGDDEGQLRIRPDIAASSGETLRRLAVEGAGITCLSDFLTHSDRAAGSLVPVLSAQTLDVFQSIHAVYYRNTAVSARVRSFLDVLAAEMQRAPFVPVA
ncbi:LysR substrate-binding domain-containing protein [Stenotrophomonas sp. CFBP 13718]|uniref:LysR substrate-binding domain-containing protein n=1 Tax=Stenotrophomonas sp. CFBP 13718 TaxID=2775304 RepID=UPI001783F904|nr:LysR substrate-binding domain-containing protein [Stenotrophomonas sp. CFBP 13718]MBD8697403.1 LysR family transcriptional regulator [Stenotrophomonas sp. CFBP 13718]